MTDIRERPSPGPYMNDDGDWWFPVDAWTWNEAQSEASDMARDSDGVARYIGKEQGVGCHDHEDWEYSEDECCRRTAYHFTVENKW